MVTSCQPYNYGAIIWDFDGVIKESVSVKTAAYRQLFAEYGPSAQDWVQAHHEANGGVSRFVKIPFYYRQITGKNLLPAEAAHSCKLFGDMVLESVVASPWVPGVKEYLDRQFKKQQFYIVTGTPQDEIELIVTMLGISHYFQKVFGSPMEKQIAVATILASTIFSPDEVLMIGDSITDYHAAIDNGISFLLREGTENSILSAGIACERFGDFEAFDPVPDDAAKLADDLI